MTKELLRRADIQQINRLRPVIGTGGCLGHVLMSAKGFRAFDYNDRELGVFLEPGDAVRAILESPDGQCPGC